LGKNFGTADLYVGAIVDEARLIAGRLPAISQHSSATEGEDEEEEEETAAVWRCTDIKKQNGTEVENVYL